MSDSRSSYSPNEKNNSTKYTLLKDSEHDIAVDSTRADPIQERDVILEVNVQNVPFYKTCQHKFCFRVGVFCFIFGLDLLDLVSDWLFYYNVAATEQGLVFGPPDSHLVNALLIFAIIGSFAFTLEVSNLWFEVFRDKGWVDSELASAITLWIEDVPQITISVAIAGCRERAISYFQLIKAAVVILGCTIRVILVFVNFCGIKAPKESDSAAKDVNALCHVFCRVCIVLAAIITLAGGIAVFILTDYRLDKTGDLQFRKPHYAMKGELDIAVYFHNVSIYLSHPLFDYDHEQHLTATDVNWFRMMTIYDVTQSRVDRRLEVEYDLETKSKIIIWQSDNHNHLHAVECFEINRTAKQLQKVTLSRCENYIGSLRTSKIIFKFHFKTPKYPSLTFGDITYNVLIKEQTHCRKSFIQVFNDVIKRITSVSSQVNTAAMFYFRNENGTSAQNHVIHLPGSTNGKFYQLDNLIKSATIWRRGFPACKSTGSQAPHLDSHIHIDCI